jgi:hypothetical protein
VEQFLSLRRAARRLDVSVERQRSERMDFLRRRHEGAADRISGVEFPIVISTRVVGRSQCEADEADWRGSDKRAAGAKRQP